jgi:hypothetical protein
MENWKSRGWVNIFRRSGKLEKSGMGKYIQKEWKTGEVGDG